MFADEHYLPLWLYQSIRDYDELLMSMALRVAADDGAVENVEGGKQSGRTVAAEYDRAPEFGSFRQHPPP
jgi:hypothetical protein